MAKGSITGEHAVTLVKKLKAEVHTKRRGHDLVVVYFNDERLTQFGLRRGKKGQPHDHIPDALRLSRHDTRLLVSCRITAEQWVEMFTNDPNQ